MRLVKLLCVLITVVSLICVSSFTVSAAEDSDPVYREDTTSGWYVIQYTDFKNVTINGITDHIDENQDFPNFEHAYNATGDPNRFVVDLAFWEDKYINIPANYSLMVEARFRYAKGPNYTTSIPITNDNFQFKVYDNNSQSFISASSRLTTDTLNYYEYTTCSLNLPNPTSNIKIRYFRFELSGMDYAQGYRLTVDSIRFKVLDADQTNANIITNGWTANPQKPSGSGKVDQQTQLEEQIKNDTAAGRQETNDILNSAPSIIGNYTNGFLFLMGLFGLATDIPLLDSLLNISLAMGLFIFFLNLVPSIVSSVQRSSNKKRGG